MTSLPLVTGTLLGPYEILALIGRGGMGGVYRARDTRLGREVAVKVLSEDAGDTSRRERIEREARAIASLNHPSICTLYDIGFAGDTPYLVMELLEGEPLSAKLASGPLSIAEVLSVGLGLSRGLEHAHARGVIHGDIKPANILLTTEGHAKLVDFGIATRGTPDTDDLSAATTTVGTNHSIVGSLPYMSPEQARGESIGPGSDLFSFGATLYEMVTGVPAFLRVTRGATFEAILTETPAAPTTTNPGCPPALEDAVATLLSKNPAQRFASAGHLVKELAAISEMVDASRLKLFSARFTTFSSRKKSVAVTPFRDLSAEQDQAYFCDGIVEELIAALAAVPSLRVPSRLSVSAALSPGLPLEVVASRLEVEAVLHGSVRKSVDRLRVNVRLTRSEDGEDVWAEQFTGTLADIFTIQEQIAQATVSALKLNLLSPNNLMRKHSDDVDAYNLYLMSRQHWNARTVDGLRRSIALTARAIELDPGYAIAHAAQAMSYATMASYTPAHPVELIDKARTAAHLALSLSPDLPEVHTLLGLVNLMFDWDWETAEAEFALSIRLNPTDATALQWFSFWHLVKGHPDEALRLTRHAEQLEPASLIASSQLGWLLYFVRRFPDAIEQLNRTVARDRQFWRAYMFGAWCHAATGDFDRALETIETAIALNDYPLLRTIRAYVHAKAGQSSRCLEELSTLARETTYVSRYYSAIAYVALGDESQAMRLLREAVENREWYVIFLDCEPALDPIRRHPDFDDLRRAVRLIR